MKRPRAGELVSKLFRVLRYGTLATAPAGLLTFVKVYGYRWWMALVFIPPFILAWLADPKVQKGENDYANKNNEDWQRHLKETEEILKLLRQKKDADESTPAGA